MPSDDKNLYYDSNTADLFPESEDRLTDPSTVIAQHGYRDPANYEIRVGTMPNNSGWSYTLTDGVTKCSIAKGYHDGRGSVYAESSPLDKLTPGTAQSSDIRMNQVAWVNGERIVGTLDIPAAKTEGTAVAKDLRVGKTAWVNGEKIVGNLQSHPRQDIVLDPGDSYTVPIGIHDGGSIISTESLLSLTKGTANATSILRGHTAWVNGEKITGSLSMDTADIVKERLNKLIVQTGNDSASPEDVRKDIPFLGKNGESIGSMPEHISSAPVTVGADYTYTIPYGYHDGLGKVIGAPLNSQTPGDATAADVRTNKIAWVNGNRIIGTMDQTIMTSSADATADPIDVTYGKTAYSKGKKITGTNKNDSIKYKHISDNIDDPAGVVVALLPINAWESINHIFVQLIEKSTSNIIKQDIINDLSSGGDKDGSFYRLVSTFANKTINITPKAPNPTNYIRVYIMDFIPMKNQLPEPWVNP